MRDRKKIKDQEAFLHRQEKSCLPVKAVDTKIVYILLDANKHMLLLMLVLFSGKALFSQEKTVNSGMLYVSPGTQLSTVNDFNNLNTGEIYNDGEIFIYADFLNDGLVDFYLETGLTRFEGFQVQSLSGIGHSYYKEVLFDNKSDEVPFRLSSSMNVEGMAHFRNGIIDNGNYGGVFSFGASANYSGASNSSHVQGPVRKISDSKFEFPIGERGYLRYAAISGSVQDEKTFEATYFSENSNNLYPHTSKNDIILEIDTSEYWTIKSLGGQQDLMITLSWNENTTSSSIQQHLEAIHIVRWDEEQQLWVDEGGTVDESTRSVTTAVSKFGVFALATVEIEDLLPCELVVYNAVTPDNDGFNDYFIVDQNNNMGCAQRISVKIFNRWGVKVFETDDYGGPGQVFDGTSKSRGSLGRGKLPTATYFYLLEFDYEDQRGKKRSFSKTGYLYLNNN